MHTKLILLALGGPLLLAAPAMQAQQNLAGNSATNSAANLSTSVAANHSSSAANTNVPIRKFPKALADEQLLLPAGLKEKLLLTDPQKLQLKSIEDDFASTSREYKIANQPRIDAAQEANRQASVSGDKGQIQAAHTQLQQVWAGLQPYRVAAVARFKPLLTPDQIKLLEDPKNQWRENHAAEASVPPEK